VADQTRRLVRRSTAGRIAGVCAGIAEYLDTDVTLVRLAWVVLSIVPGGFIGGFVAYVAAWIVMPDAPGPVTTTSTSGRRLTRSVVDRRIGGVCGGLAAYLDVDSTAIRVVWVVLSIVPGCIVMGVVAYVVAWFIMPEPTSAVTQTVPNVA
jgi:phage shock protein PspC (stress-responsive transcriptional regulator)